jgi:4'-phosphopantetheinyl transferase
MTDTGTLVVASGGLPDARQASRLRRDLPAAEWQWITRLKQPEDRLRSLTGRSLARRLLARRLGGEPAGVRLTAGPRGKPALADTHAAWQFNIAHSGDQVLVAIGPVPVGVDVECCPETVDAALWESVTGKPSHHASAQAFCAEWVRREAVLKACGTGLGQSPARLCLSDDGDGWQRADGLPHAGTPRVRLLWESPAHCAALCLPAAAHAWRLARLAPADWIDELPPTL